ncbi:hypothetical protein EJV47_23835 [Hymenobacter gummosus]|uniref:Outer membrane protein beta-barrel domain-containing protein n=1 Tax=Hymenobacter gummosus TaxID=1776032 RepID=A0A3S0HJT5_9BACT|nr:hypothetical protein [Hymenobacter gummosus]RTQ45864.1 hypothetical protein EJV47_23835 [Hymenobacter gummosus]
MRPFLYSAFLLTAALLASTTAAQAQEAQDTPGYQKEFTYGINLNTNAGLIGGVAVRSTRRITDDWARFWILEGVEVKTRKEQRVQNNIGGVYVRGKTNYLFALRPTVGVQRTIFRKAAESGVEVDGMLGAGPSIALLLPYYIYFDYTPKPDPQTNPNPREDIRPEQYDPVKHADVSRIYDRAPIFSGIGDVKPNIGAHLRGALNFEYGRYRDAVAGVEAGMLVEAYTKRLVTLEVPPTPTDKLNNNVFTSVYVTLYIGSRK